MKRIQIYIIGNASIVSRSLWSIVTWPERILRHQDDYYNGRILKIGGELERNNAESENMTRKIHRHIIKLQMMYYVVII